MLHMSRGEIPKMLTQTKDNKYFRDQHYIEGDFSIDMITITANIGRGNSDVYLGIVQGRKVAIKQTEIVYEYQYHAFLREIAMLKSLSKGCDAIIKYEGYFLTSVNSKLCGAKKYGYMLMEQAQMNLDEFIKSKQQNKSRPTRKEINMIASTLLNGFSYLQSQNIAHCDIKPQNILLSTLPILPIPQSPTKLLTKICDVGSCKQIDTNQQSQQTIKGTLSFLAPELLQIKQQKITSINAFRSDVYSYGLVLLYLITGKKFNLQQRKDVSQEVYFQVIGEWVRLAAEILCGEEQVVEVLRKALEGDHYKRPLFRELKAVFQSISKKNKIAKENKIKQLTKNQSAYESIDAKKQSQMTILEKQKDRIKLPKIKGSSSSTLISFHSRQKLTQKISIRKKSQLSKKSSQKSDKSKRSKQRQKQFSRPKNSPRQKTTTYSTFSMDKSKFSSCQLDTKKIFNITSQNHQSIPFDSLNQTSKIFVLFHPVVPFEAAHSVVIKKECSVEVFEKLAGLRRCSNLYLEYEGVEIFGTDQNTPTIPNFESVFINLQNSVIEGGYNNLLRCLCPISLRNLHLQLSGSSITYQEVRQQLERIKTKDIQKLDLCWDNATISPPQFLQLTQKISRLPLRKLTLSLSYTYISPSPSQISRWLLPPTLKILYLNLSNNFLSASLTHLSISLAALTQLKQLYINLENNSLNETDLKIIVKSVGGVKGLEKAVCNFSWNCVGNWGYWWVQEFGGAGREARNSKEGREGRISSLEIRVVKCQIGVEEFYVGFRKLLGLFHDSLKILKIAYDRAAPKWSIMRNLEQIIKEQFGQGLKLNIVSYDHSHFMIYIKKKLQQTQKNIRIKTNPNDVLTSRNNPTQPQKPLLQKSGTTNSSSTLFANSPLLPITSPLKYIKQVMETQFSIDQQISQSESRQLPSLEHKISMKSIGEKGTTTVHNYNNKTSSNTNISTCITPHTNHLKISSKHHSMNGGANQENNDQRGKVCEALFSKYPSYEHYICLDCIQVQESFKNQYYCRACIQSCQHKDHYIVRTYDKKTCNCPYSNKCAFTQKQDNYNETLCADRMGIEYKREYECERCFPNASICQACIQSCRDLHVEFVVKKGVVRYRCFQNLREGGGMGGNEG